MALWTRTCIGCGNTFETYAGQQRRCAPRCGYDISSRARSRSLSRYDGREFIGVDGEGVTNKDGEHFYTLLSVGDESLTIPRQGKHYERDSRLSHREIFPFLWEQFEKHPNAIFGGFYLSYDFSQWFRSFPEERARMLFTKFGIAQRQPKSERQVLPFPVSFEDWEFDMLGLRRFKLRPRHSSNKIPWFYICDFGPFWQTSFLNAIDPESWTEPVLTEREHSVILAGKDARSTAHLNNKMIEYNTLENDVLARIMGRMERGFSAQGWDLKKSQFFGPGQVAQLWLNQIKAPTSEQVQEVTPVEVLKAAQASYYGGWFEIPRHGHVPGTTYEYDINSAYPHIISTLPCLLHGTWTRHCEPQHGLTLVYVDTQGSDPYLGGLPHRDKDGIISRPLETEGWYWYDELQAACDAGLIDTYRISDAWTYHPCNCPPPLEDIRRLYEQRLELGKNTIHGKSVRLVYNSAYGKFAQSLGSPKYANPIYASRITSGCRTLILGSIATHPLRSAAVLMVATDGVYFSSRHPTLTLSKTELGAWDEGTKQNLTLFMPGVYWDDKSRQRLAEGKSPKLKSRGINARELADKISEIDDRFRSYVVGSAWPCVTVPVRFSVISPQLALARNNWDLCGTIKVYRDDLPADDPRQTTKELSSNPSNKRQPEAYLQDGLITTRPYKNRGPNYGYEKRFGMILEALQNNDDLVTEDGSINFELIDMLGVHE